MADYALIKDGKIVNKISTEDALKEQKLIASGYLPMTYVKPVYDSATEKLTEVVTISKDAVTVTYAKAELPVEISKENLIRDRIMKLLDDESAARRQKAIDELVAEGAIEDEAIIKE